MQLEVEDPEVLSKLVHYPFAWQPFPTLAGMFSSSKKYDSLYGGHGKKL